MRPATVSLLSLLELTWVLMASTIRRHSPWSWSTSAFTSVRREVNSATAARRLVTLEVTGWVWGGGGEVFLCGRLEGHLPLSGGVLKMGARGGFGGSPVEVEARAFPLALLPAMLKVDVASGGHGNGGEWV